MKEQEKLKYEGEVFKATYKKSIYIDDVNELLAGTADPEKNCIASLKTRPPMTLLRMLIQERWKRRLLRRMTTDLILQLLP